MGRPPCCYKVGIKKGPWTPEEDIILVSYIQENGPGNWRSVPTNTGLLRCSKSCRLRWTNYLRPGIKRGNFTSHEEGMIIHLQALLGNKWAAIASYLPQRTDNDIKNYWNTHLKKKLKKFQSALDPHNTIHMPCDHPQLVFNKTTTSPRASLLDHHLLFTNNTGSSNSSSSTTTLYASSTENISRLLQGWMRSSSVKTDSNSRINTTGIHLQDHHELVENGNNLVSHQDEFESILSFENMNNDNIKVSSLSTCEKNDVKGRTKEEKHDDEKKVDENHDVAMEKNDTNNNKQRELAQPLSFLEKWLLDESSISSGGTVSHNVEEMLQLSPMF